MALLRIDARDEAAQAAAEAAIRAADPSASITPDWAARVVDVTGDLPVETLCANLRFAGFRVETLFQRPRRVDLFDFLTMTLQTLGFTLFGGIGGMILGGILGYLYQSMDPSCVTVLEGGPCASAILKIAFCAGLIGAVVSGVMTLIVGALRLAHLHRTGDDVPFLRF